MDHEPSNSECGCESCQVEREHVRWQERIADTIHEVGLDPFDASGSDSGDPLDWTDDQVRVALYDARARGIEDVIVWMQDHLSGISSPNASDYGELREWCEAKKHGRPCPLHETAETESVMASDLLSDEEVAEIRKWWDDAANAGMWSPMKLVARAHEDVPRLLAALTAERRAQATWDTRLGAEIRRADALVEAVKQEWVANGASEAPAIGRVVKAVDAILAARKVGPSMSPSPPERQPK